MDERTGAGSSHPLESRDPIPSRNRPTRGLFEEEVRRCLADLSAARAALGQGLGSPEHARPSETLERLARLETSVHDALERIDEHLRQESFMLARTSGAEMEGGEFSARTRRELAAANAMLQREITERERLERESRRVERGLREVRQLFESAFHHAPIGMALIGADGRWLQVNDALCRLTGLSGAELSARSLHEITHPDDAGPAAHGLERLLSGEIPSYQLEKRYRHARGHDVWVLETASIVRDDEFRPAHLVVQVQDISERKKAAQHIEFIADHDSLSGLCNRRCFDRALARETERSLRYGVPGAVILIDLDRFKDVNDDFGHRTGDDVIRQVATALRRRLRHTDVLARMGGDEFAAILPEISADEVRGVAGELVRTVERETVVVDDRAIRVTASIGVALFDGRAAAELLGCADLAMYEAKKRGRNRFEMYRRPRRGRVARHCTRTEHLQHAIPDDRLLL